MAAGGSLQDAAAALSIAAAIDVRSQVELAHQARIIPTADGSLAKIADRSRVFLGGELVGEEYGFTFVDPEFLEIPDVQSNLQALQFSKVDSATEFRAVLTRASEGWSDEKWAGLWDLMDHVSSSEVRRCIETHVGSGRPIRVRTLSGEWRSPQHVIDGSAVGIEIEDARRKLDSSYHSRDLARAAGVIVGVDPQFPVVEDEIFADYKAWAIEDFQKRIADDCGTERRDLFLETLRAAGSVGRAGRLPEEHPRLLAERVVRHVGLVSEFGPNIIVERHREGTARFGRRRVGERAEP